MMPKARYIAVTALLLLFLAAAPLLAQCPLCRTAASAASEATAVALNKAILVLLAPAMMLFCGVFAYAYRARNREDSPRAGVDDEEEEEDW